ncbi:MAG: FAD-binding monooxygenase [Micromonosporaceae bacterium]|nr:FAD-binding monooxygenase [Micromonosporaceae bacterium]
MAVVGAGPIGLTTALGLAHYRVPFLLLEEDEALSNDTKAGTVLTRSLEIWDRYGVAGDVLAEALRVDEIGDLERATNQSRTPVRLDTLTEDTRFPFVINIPQYQLEPILHRALERAGGKLLSRHRLESFTRHDDRVTLQVSTPEGKVEIAASHLLACDGGRSTVRAQLGTPVVGHTLPEKYLVVDFLVDLDVANPRDYPYLAYFSDPHEWMVLIRQPDCWRFLFPLPDGGEAPDEAELLAKARRFIGDVDQIEVRGSVVYPVHQRVAQRWSDGDRVFLLGDAAHLVTPMWALGLNTGMLDASNLPWRLAWVRRGWAGPELLAGYEREQQPVAAKGSAEMAEQARLAMAHQRERVKLPSQDWALARTRSLLGVRLDVDGSGDWSMVTPSGEPAPLRPGDRLPDLPVFGTRGPVRLHDLTRDSFAALYLTDVRRRPPVPANTSPALQHWVVSRWDAPIDSGLRDRALLDVGGRATARLGLPSDTLVLVRPDQHVAAVLPITDRAAEQAYQQITGRTPRGDD